MPRKKEQAKIYHKANAHEIISCLASMPSYSRILLNHGPSKSYKEFLKMLIEKRFYRSDQKTAINKIAKECEIDTSKVAKWLFEIYEDIYTLNEESPVLFQDEGIKVTLLFSNYDDHCTMNVTLPVIPREFEKLDYHFVKGKVGIDIFWVEQVRYSIDNDNPTIDIWLEGGFVNRYREFTIDRALFHGKINFDDVFRKYSFQVDEEIRSIYRH